MSIADQPGTADRQALLDRIDALEKRVTEMESERAEDKVSMVVFSGDLDRVLAAFVIATGAAAMGQKVDMYFTFWGLTAIKKRTEMEGKSLLQRMMAMMTPGSSETLPVSRMNWFGAGAKMLRMMMKERNVESLEDLMQLARDLDVNIIACDMSQGVMGISDAELMDDLEHGGVGTFLGSALTSKATLFI